MDQKEVLFWIRKAKDEKLDGLDLSRNNISTLPPEIGELKHLSALDLSGTGLTALPPGIGQLANLKILTARKNRLVDLPKEIGQLTNLMTLDLSENQLTSLPAEIGRLTNLTNLDLRGNPLSIPFEILEKTNEPNSILSAYFGITFDELFGKGGFNKFFNEIFNPDRHPLLETKLLIVGQGSVGKTSLIQRLMHNTFDQNQTKTDGISINHWEVSGGIFKEILPDLEGPFAKIKLNIWDFGGQEIMHATHQFFLTKRSLYLLVLDSRLTQEENRVEYWLKIIQSFGGDSLVLIVGNKIDQHPLDIDRTGLQKKYPNIVGILETSAATGAGIESLKAEIANQVNTLPHVRDLLPETWFTVKTKLEQLGQETNFISHDDYDKLCDMNDVHDETSQHTLIGFLHDLGVVLYFQDDPRLESLGILNPQWVTNGVYKILNSHELFRNQGVLTITMLDDILNVPEYPRGKRLFIVDMMKKFELCYDIEPDKTFLVPDLLPKDQPELKFNGMPAFEYQYPVLPSSIMTRFIVRMNRHIQADLVWRSGVVLKIGENLALVKADAEDKTISIAIDGLEHTRRDALSAIRYQLDEIHASIKGLNPQKRVPIPNAPNAEPLDYDYLLQLERDNELKVLPVKDGSRLVKVNIRQLLSGIENEVQRKENTVNVINNIINPGVYVGGDVGGNVVVGDENDINQ
jgi:internalin A